jgi:hypothetical protein
MDLSSEESSFGDDLPFAYEAKIDTLAYMSCSGMEPTASASAFFTFRFGSWADGAGIRLNDNFLKKAAQYSVPQIARALQEGEKNSNIQLQMSMRMRSDYQAIWRADGSDPAPGRDFYNFLGDLDSEVISKQLSELPPDKWMQYVQTTGLDSRTFDGSLYINQDVGEHDQTIGKMQSTQSLMLTYTGRGSDYMFAARSPVDLTGQLQASSSNAYGMGYTLTFIRPSNVTAEKMPNRVVSSVQEFNLEKKSDMSEGIAPWSCNTSLLIVRDQDSAGRCTKVQDAGQADQALMTKLRRVLPASDWYINLAQKCVVPKSSGSCYGSMAAPTTTNYTVAYPPTSGAAVTNCNLFVANATTNTLMCPHYVSLCTRQ